MSSKFTKEEALQYHSQGRPGKIELGITKAVATQRDLSLAYTPGVAEPVREIAASPATAYSYTAKGNLVAVVSNGTAVLGLGNVGPLAGKPVMEGKGVLFKRFADIDVFDIELDAADPDEVIRVVRALAPTFGGINLEDIKAPDCFRIEATLRRELDIPVFHDDQHGTAIIAGAGLLNALEIAGKRLEEASIVISGAGAAAIACARFFVNLGARREHITLCDSKGVVFAGRTENMNEFKAEFARETGARTLAEAMAGTDVFIGCSAKGLVTPDMVRSMAARPIIFALANPDPEISYEEARAARPDAIVATGRSDYPNQVNNVLGFPFIFRGALDVHARDINETMKVAAAQALAALAREEVPAYIGQLYGVESLSFGPDYIIPKPLDPRVLTWVAPAVAATAMASGVAQVQVDLAEYRSRLSAHLSMGRDVKGQIMVQARRQPKRVVFCEGENPQVLRAAALAKQEGIAEPIVLGRRDMIATEIARLGISAALEIVDPKLSPRLPIYLRDFYAMRQRRGVTRGEADELIHQPVYFAAMMLRKDEADALVGGPSQHASQVMQPALQVVRSTGKNGLVAGMSIVIVKDNMYYLTDTLVNVNPSADALAEIALMAEERVRAMGMEPRLAMLSFANFGSSKSAAAAKMRQAAEIVKALRPEVVCDGEVQADLAIDHARLEQEHPFSDLTGAANILVFPNLDAANISCKLLQTLGEAEVIGPILLGASKPVYVLRPGDSVADIVATAAMAVADVQNAEERLRRWSAHKAAEAEGADGGRPAGEGEGSPLDSPHMQHQLERMAALLAARRHEYDPEGEFCS